MRKESSRLNDWRIANKLMKERISCLEYLVQFHVGLAHSTQVWPYTTSLYFELKTPKRMHFRKNLSEQSFSSILFKTKRVKWVSFFSSSYWHKNCNKNWKSRPTALSESQGGSVFNLHWKTLSHWKTFEGERASTLLQEQQGQEF